MSKKFIDGLFFKYQDNTLVKKFVTNLFTDAITKSEVIIINVETRREEELRCEW
jgi:hypothetical protein